MSLQEKEYLEIFKKQMEDLLDWGDSDTWSNLDFEKLSDMVFEKTGVTISVSTLKRILGKVKYDSIPTTTTLNTLVQFAGYESWRCFCAKQLPGAASNQSKQPDKTEKAKNLKPFKRIYAGLLAALILIPVLIWMSFFNTSHALINHSKIIFNSRTVSDDLPNSVVFNYDIGDNHTDNVVIQQSWDPSRREKVPANGHQHTSIYYLPGFFMAKLLINNTIVSRHEVYIETRGWKGIIRLPGKNKPVYLSDEEINKKNGSMEVNNQTLSAKTGSTVFNDTWTTLWNVHEFKEVNPADFTFTTTLQNTSTKEASICQQASVYIFTSDGFIQIPLCAKGCTSNVQLNIAGITVDGKDHDLSAFGCDPSVPHQITITVKDTKAIVYLDQKQAFTTSIAKPLGRVAGLLIGFEGTGKIADIKIK